MSANKLQKSHPTHPQLEDNNIVEKMDHDETPNKSTEELNINNENTEKVTEKMDHEDIPNENTHEVRNSGQEENKQPENHPKQSQQICPPLTLENTQKVAESTEEVRNNGQEANKQPENQPTQAQQVSPPLTIDHLKMVSGPLNACLSPKLSIKKENDAHSDAMPKSTLMVPEAPINQQLMVEFVP